MVNETEMLDELNSVLRQLLGPERLTIAPDERALMSQDIWSRGKDAAFVARPKSLEQLQTAVAAAHERGVALNPRGGGMSYTNGYTPDREHVGVLDMTGLDRVLEINADDMYVTVEAGCTWKTLNDELAAKGLRTPFWGPLSGLTSTIGGGLSQNNAFFGAGTYGPTSDSVTSVAVVIGDGTLVRTGTGGSAHGKPFWRHYGPDLTGLFLGDCGAFGHKAEASFRLIPAPEHENWASFEFASREDCALAMAEMAREGLACELFGFDPNLQRLRMARATLASDIKTIGKVMLGQGSRLKGLKESARIAMAGRGFMDDAAYSLHLVVEGRSKAGVEADLDRLKSIARKHGAKDVENSIPKIIRANPFTPLNNMLGPGGERWVPVHGIVPLSEGPATWAEIDALFDSVSTELEAHEVLTGYLVTSLSTNGYLIEPVFIWPEELFAIHEASVEVSWLEKLPRHASNPEATAFVDRLREQVIDIFRRRGSAHFQVGRFYPYAESRTQGTRFLLERLKAALDPYGRVNPGVLGLG
jgi:FAD/FMN-containing dehydrogenase